MKTKVVTITHPADGGKSKVTIEPYYEIGDRVLVFGKRPAVVIADQGVVVISSWDAWVEQRISVNYTDDAFRPLTDRVKTWNSGDVTPVASDDEIPF